MIRTRLKRSAFRYYLAWKYGIHARKPLLLKRQLEAAYDVFVKDRPRLRYVDVSVDFPCNLRCEHCFTKAFERSGVERPRVTLDGYRKIARECRELGAIAFSFQGGEPFLFLDRLEEVIRAFEPESSLISVTTNGTLATPESVRRLRRAGVDIFTISVDSGDAAEHDSFRGLEGAFERTMRTVDLALEAGIRVTIGTTVHHGNVRSPGLEKLMNLAVAKRCQLVFALAVPAGNWQGNDEILLTAEDMRTIDGYCQKSPFVRIDTEGNYRHTGCGAAKEILYLTPYGDVLTCPFLHISFGTAPAESMADIRARALENPYLERYWPRCLAAADPAFRERILKQLRDRDDLPVPHDEVRWPDEAEVLAELARGGELR